MTDVRTAVPMAGDQAGMELPYRGELLSAERIGDAARRLARAQTWTTESPPATTPLIPLLKRAAASLESDNAVLTTAVRNLHPVSPATEWLLDNYYLIDEQVRAVLHDLPERYGVELPRLTTDPLKGFPRIYEATISLVAYTDARLDEEFLGRFVQGFQDVSPLTIGETWAVPIMLRVALVENLRRLSARVVASYRATRAADEWAERLLLTAQDRPDELRSLLGELGEVSGDATPAFFVRLSQRLQGEDAGSEATNAFLARRFVSAGYDLDALAHSLQQEQAADQVSIANSITSVRFLEAFDWKGFFEETSFVELILRTDPVGVYARMDFHSRDRYRHVLEKLARRCALGEIAVAEAAMSWALEGAELADGDPALGHVGYYLIGEGRPGFEESIAYSRSMRDRFETSLHRHRALFYWGSIAAITAVLAAVLAFYALSSGTAPVLLVPVILLALIPLSDVALTVTNRLAAAAFPPRVLPKLDYLEPLEEPHRTLVVVPALLTSVGSVRSVLDNIEVAYLANRDEQLGFGLLGDLRGGDSEHREGDSEIIEAAIRGVAELNERYAAEHGRSPFFMFMRGRTFNETEGTWMGWERKRGSLVELNHLLKRSRETSFTHRIGDESFLAGVTFVLTLDADTQLPRDTARKLVSTIAHPLNRARWTPGEPIVRRGYGLIQPRVSMALPASTRSFYAWLHSGVTGIDPYSGAVSDTYQDVFAEGSFTGKGIYEINVFEGVLDGAIPENTLLSHDLLEGCFVRVGLASDIEVLDDYPAAYRAQAARLHRWVRGDWQTLPWLGGRIPREQGTAPNPLTPLHRWKMIDNLRRSLSGPAMLALLTLGWALLPGPAWAWPLIMMLMLLFPVYFSAANGLLFRTPDVPFLRTASTVWANFGRDSARTLLALAILPHHAYQMIDAASRALWRMWVSRRNLLEWETAADVERSVGPGVSGYLRRLGPAAVAAIVLLMPGTLASPMRAAVAAPLIALFAAGPFVAWRVSRTRALERRPLEPALVQELRRTARSTWRFFETFVGPEGNHLAPDNFQEDPKGEVAYRTSPTNIGLQLIAGLTAYDLGYQTLGALVERTADTLSSMAGMRRFRGHFYNWYDTRTLEPLPPHYISTVDSGNLAGHLLVLRGGLLEASEAPVLGPQLRSGLEDTVALALHDLAEERTHLTPEESVSAVRTALEELRRDAAIADQPADAGAWHALLMRWYGLAERALDAAGDLESIAAPAVSADPLHVTDPAARIRASLESVTGLVTDALSLLETFAPWAAVTSEVPRAVATDVRAAALAPLLAHVPSLVGLSEGLDLALEALDSIAQGPPGEEESERSTAARWAGTVAAGVRSARPGCTELLGRLRLSADIAREMWEHTDFSVLFDERRLLFSIGYNTAEGHLDDSYYDMLASECRLASFLSIAKGDVPQEHWFRLGRQITRANGGQALLSWSASMFEYLMPLLVMRSWPLTLLDQTYDAVVRRQIHYGRELGVPWGVSESAFNVLDADLTYQYQAFGVPGLGLKRGLSEDIVIAPYATLLALPVAADHVHANLGRLADIGARGRYGYYEAVDFTPGRVPAGERRAVVRSYFAHHQGMSFVAIGNALTGDRMRERFHCDPTVASAELLLQERAPRAVALATPHVAEVESVRSVEELPVPVTRSYPLADTPAPATHFLSNGRYSVMVTNGGGGYSRYKGISVTRYREDITRDCWGHFFYLRDVDSGAVWSAAHNPVPTRPDSYHVTFSADKAEYYRRDGDIETRTEVAVSPEDDVEVRRLTVSNRGLEPHRIEVTSYFEIALTDQGGDQAHKAFSNLFVETEAVDTQHTLLFSRRPRSSAEERLWGFHVLGCEDGSCEWSYESDRARFLGRLHGADTPAAVHAGGALSGTAGAVLDPACAIRHVLELGPGESARLAYVTGVAASRDEALTLAERYQDIRTSQRAIDLSWTAAQIELRDLGIAAEDAVVLQRLASRLLLTDPYSPLKAKTPVENGLPISGLWSLGISGDNPILLVRIDEPEHAPLVRQALLAHQYWRHKGLVSDLVVLNTRPTAYSDELDDRLRLLVRTGHALQLVDKPGGVFLRRSDQMHPDVLNLLESVARAVLEGDGGTIELQLNRRGERPVDPPALEPVSEPREFDAPAFERPSLVHDNGLGGFDPQTSEYVIVLEDGATTPAPWVNVMATPEFGCLVSEAGIGCTWAVNSHENRITTWNNDPVSDGSGEVIYIRDEETGEYWSPTPLPCRSTEPFVVRHGFGYTRFEHISHGIAHELDWFVPAEDPVRLVRLRLTNVSAVPRRLTATQFVEWVLGSSRSQAQHLVVTWFDAEHDMLTAHNHYNPDFPGRPTFLACDRPLHSWTASRSEFVGRNRRPAAPAAMERERLDGRSGRFHDNCGALMTGVSLAPGESSEITFMLGQTERLEEARGLVARYRSPGSVDRALEGVRAMWAGMLQTVQVSTPDPTLDLLVNGRLLYQSLACRLWGRTATYQSSGALGFRDQLQDTLGLALARPDLMRAQIVEASRRQFEQGDVLHWWQPLSGRGVRTRITDDRHWLAFVTAEYVAATGDTSVLDVRTPFIEAPLLEPGAEDAYVQPTVSEKTASVYEHCTAALDLAFDVGAHGLPLIGGGDWNDGMNRVGHEGLGESVWLAWFLDVTLRAFAPLCELKGETDRAERYREHAARLVAAADESGWDGGWYRRAYFDDGTPLGTKDAEECRIDAIAQAWAVISGQGDPVRAARALESVEEKLVRMEDGLVALLSPPFDRMSHDPGYIKGYVPGVRENGGQYTHAAIWVALAHLLRGDGDEGVSLIDLINPINHALDAGGVARYKVEPYVVAADVYAVAPHTGRGGWTWYTGSASWFYRVAINNLLGLRPLAQSGQRHFTVDPCIPKTWPGFEMIYRDGDSTYHITVENPRGVNRGVAWIELDGAVLDEPLVPLAGDGREHYVKVMLLGG
ncbi:MAG: GH36-type glycosyl hydrolase domain-containing protein [Anaerosomatales bacterium]